MTTRLPVKPVNKAPEKKLCLRMKDGGCASHAGRGGVDADGLCIEARPRAPSSPSTAAPSMPPTPSARPAPPKAAVPTADALDRGERAIEYLLRLPLAEIEEVLSTVLGVPRTVAALTARAIREASSEALVALVQALPPQELEPLLAWYDARPAAHE